MPDETPEAKPVAVPAIGFSIEAKLTQNRTIVAQFHTPGDGKKKDLDAQLDRIMASIERQEAIGVVKGLKILIPREEALLAENVKKRGALADAYQREWRVSNRKGEFKPFGPQATNLANQDQSIEGLKNRIADLKKQLAECQGMVDDDGADGGSANR